MSGRPEGRGQGEGFLKILSPDSKFKEKKKKVGEEGHNMNEV